MSRCFHVMVIAPWKISLPAIVPYLRMHRRIFCEFPEGSQGCCSTVRFPLCQSSGTCLLFPPGRSRQVFSPQPCSVKALCIKQPSLESSLYSASGVAAGSAPSVRIEVHSLFLDSGAARLKLAPGFGVNNKSYLTLDWLNSFET